VTELVKHDSEALTLLALGHLSEPEARVVEAHLTGCAQCARAWEAARDTAALLGEHIPEEFFSTERADSSDLIFARTLRDVRKEKRTHMWHRRRAPILAAAVAVVIALTGAVTVGRVTAPEPTPTILQAAGARTVQGTGVGGASLQATVAPAATGDTVQLLVNATGLPRGAHCELFVVTADGTKHLAGSWTVPAGGPIQGSAAVNMSQVAAVAVSNADTGQELAYLDV
jgi:anti-sigma-K factor RskA